MTAVKKQILVGYHPGDVIEAAERYLARWQAGQRLSGEDQANHDIYLLIQYGCQWTCDFGNGEKQVQNGLPFHKWIYYLLASEYAARALDMTKAFPNGAPDALLGS